ncbi:MAG: DNA repair protein RecO [Clostridiales bacterium]|nr:DNA repair protein RecO [Clostridiales bacterium]
MEELKIKAIVLSSTDYKEKDKIVNLFSLELGQISCILKNCRTNNYKLSFAYSPFSFGEFELIKRGEMLFIKTATLIENFYNICENYNKFIIGNSILEILLKCNKPFENNEVLFINTLKILNNLAFTDLNENILFLKFLLGTLKVNGFKLNFKYCNSCKIPYINKIYLNLETGDFECGACKSNYSVMIETNIFNLLSKINNKPIEDLTEIIEADKVILESIKLLVLNIENRFNIKINSKNFISI